MRTIIQGKKVRTTYSVVNKAELIREEPGKKRVVFKAKPKLKDETKVVGWETIKEFDEEINLNIKKYVDYFLDNRIGEISLSESEIVGVIEKIFRIDLGAYVLHLDKILNEEIVNELEAKAVLKSQLMLYNKTMIESNERLAAYCKINKLNPEETDVNDLFKIVYPDNSYSIVDGKLMVARPETCSRDLTSLLNISPHIYPYPPNYCVIANAIRGYEDN